MCFHILNMETSRDSRADNGLGLTFEHQISEPIALGRSAHFGLGPFSRVVVMQKARSKGADNPSSKYIVGAISNWQSGTTSSSRVDRNTPPSAKF
jgi:hypothetical protein